MLQKDPCTYCPAAPHFIGSFRALWNLKSDPCKICSETVGIRVSMWPHVHRAVWEAGAYRKCPCLVLGKEEALKRTVLALESFFK